MENLKMTEEKSEFPGRENWRKDEFSGMRKGALGRWGVFMYNRRRAGVKLSSQRLNHRLPECIFISYKLGNSRDHCINENQVSTDFYCPPS